MDNSKLFNRSLFIAGLAGGLIGSLIAGSFYRSHSNIWNPIALTGVYFAVLVFCILLAAGISEWCTYHLKGNMWDGQDKKNTVLLLLAGTIVCLLAGMLFQFLYGLGKQKTLSSQADDYLIMVDNSGSTSSSDRDRQRFDAVINFVSGLEPGKQVMVSVFNDSSSVVLPLTGAGEEAGDKLSEIFAQYSSDGGTDIQNTLLTTLGQYADGSRSAMAILISDGQSSVNLNEIADNYNKKGIRIFTVGYAQSGSSGRKVMSAISDSTGGAYYEISDITQLQSTFSRIQTYSSVRPLLGYRHGIERASILYTILRILFITLMGILTGVIATVMLDSEELIVPGMYVRLPASLAAGILLEVGLRCYWSDTVLRFILCILFALLVSRYTKPVYHEGTLPGFTVKKPISTRPGNAFESSSFPSSKGSFDRNSHTGSRNNSSSLGDSLNNRNHLDGSGKSDRTAKGWKNKRGL